MRPEATNVSMVGKPGHQLGDFEPEATYGYFPEAPDRARKPRCAVTEQLDA
jgi:hypothetical protein